KKKKKGYEFVIVMDYACYLDPELFGQDDIPLYQKIDRARKSNQVMEALRSRYETAKRYAQQAFDRAAQGEWNEGFRSGNAFNLALSRWVHKNKVQVKLEDVRFEDSLSLQYMLNRTQTIQQMVFDTGLRTPEQQREYIISTRQICEENARSVAWRDRNIIRQVVQESGPDRTVIVYYGAGHKSVLEHLQKRLPKNIEVDQDGLIELHQRLAKTKAVQYVIKDDVPEEDRERIYYGFILENYLFSFLTSINVTTILLNTIVPEICARWSIDEILKFVRIRDDSAAYRYVMDWLIENGTDEEKALFGISALATARIRPGQTTPTQDEAEFCSAIIKANNPAELIKQRVEDGSFWNIIPELKLLLTQPGGTSPQYEGISSWEHTQQVLDMVGFIAENDRERFNRGSREEISNINFVGLHEEYLKATDTPRKKLIFWMLVLLHDIGKAEDAGTAHLYLSSILAIPVLQRIVPDLTAAEEEKSRDLLLNHASIGTLYKGEISPGYIKDLDMEMLLVINIADIRSVGYQGYLTDAIVEFANEYMNPEGLIKLSKIWPSDRVHRLFSSYDGTPSAEREA
ncbi:MAG: hypothetical protein NTY47_01390, partial [Candidatus Omnitrophica bacterium]|nr:hypothetical protein [Candidatus Omnitrophota bacterium]